VSPQKLLQNLSYSRLEPLVDLAAGNALRYIPRFANAPLVRL
jgi:hypothetical protein